MKAKKFPDFVPILYLIKRGENLNNQLQRPALEKNLDGRTFREYYYLKEELVEFCRKNGLPVS